MAKLLILFTFIVAFQFNLSTTKATTLTTSSKDQTACTMCYSCENPCKPIPSPPPPPPPVMICPPPPPPPSPQPPTGPVCPPPPMYVKPFPPKQPRTPDTGFNGGAYYPPGGDLWPPNPVVPYFPHYYPLPSSVTSNSVQLRLEKVILSVSLFLGWLLCF